jgi:hypothetical protein
MRGRIRRKEKKRQGMKRMINGKLEIENAYEAGKYENGESDKGKRK